MEHRQVIFLNYLRLERRRVLLFMKLDFSMAGDEACSSRQSLPGKEEDILLSSEQTTINEDWVLELAILCYRIKQRTCRQIPALSSE